jgi:hypothetical protein
MGRSFHISCTAGTCFVFPSLGSDLTDLPFSSLNLHLVYGGLGSGAGGILSEIPGGDFGGSGGNNVCSEGRSGALAVDRRMTRETLSGLVLRFNPERLSRTDYKNILDEPMRSARRTICVRKRDKRICALC